MSAFQIEVECTSQVSSWSFRPQTARRPNDSSPVSTGRLNKKSASFFSASLLVPFCPSCCLLFALAFFLSSETGNSSTRIRPNGEESREGMRVCRLGNPSLTVGFINEKKGLTQVRFTRLHGRSALSEGYLTEEQLERSRWHLFYLKASGELQWHLSIYS